MLGSGFKCLQLFIEVVIHVLTVTISGRESGRSSGSQSRWVVLEKMKKSAPAQIERTVKKKIDNQIPLKFILIGIIKFCP